MADKRRIYFRKEVNSQIIEIIALTIENQFSSKQVNHFNQVSLSLRAFLNNITQLLPY